MHLGRHKREMDPHQRAAANANGRQVRPRLRGREIGTGCLPAITREREPDRVRPRLKPCGWRTARALDVRRGRPRRVWPHCGRRSGAERGGKCGKSDYRAHLVLYTPTITAESRNPAMVKPLRWPSDLAASGSTCGTARSAKQAPTSERTATGPEDAMRSGCSAAASRTRRRTPGPLWNRNSRSCGARTELRERSRSL